MSDDANQALIPPAFIQLFVPAGSLRPNVSREHIALRHELCEDLAQMLVEQAQERRWQLGVTEDDVLLRMRAGLLAPGSGVAAEEAHWVVGRLAEVLGWPQPPADGPAAGSVKG